MSGGIQIEGSGDEFPEAPDVNTPVPGDLPVVDDGPDDIPSPDIHQAPDDAEDDIPVSTTAPAPVAERVTPNPEAESDLPINRFVEEEEDDEAAIAVVAHLIAEEVFKESGVPLNDLAMSLPTLNKEEITELLFVTKNIVNRLPLKTREALMVHAESFSLTSPDGVYDGFFNNAKAKLTQTLRAEDKTPLTQSQPGYKTPKKGEILDMAQASAYAARLLEAYDVLYVIAPHSGMWLKVSVPRGTENHQLLSTMATTRAKLGYDTRGMTLSSDGAMRNMTFLNFILDRTLATNMVDSSQEAIRRNLVALDIPLIAAQMASANSPSGFPIERACSTKPGVCDHVEREVIRLSKLIWSDDDRFTAKQRAHLQTMLRKANQKTEEAMASYRAEFGGTITRRKEIGPGIFATFGAPMIDTYESTAEEWAADIERESQSTLDLMAEEEGRRHMQQQAALSVMSKYSAWVLEIDMNGTLTVDRMAIRAVLARLSERKDIVKAFTDGVTTYITDCTVAAVGVPDYKCPVCHGRQAHADRGLMKAIAPIDAVTAFFIQAQLKIRQSLSVDLES